MRRRASRAAWGAGAVLAVAACGGGEATLPPPAAPPAEGASKTPPSDPSAMKALDEGERTIDVSGGDCMRACEGLAKVIAARVSLCAPRSSACEDAERREDAATKKIAAYCDPCPRP